MTRPHSPQQTAAPVPTLSTPEQAQKLAAHLIDVMNGLLKLVERETELVRAGKVGEAMMLDADKTDLSRRYVAAIGYLKQNQRYLSQTTPELMTSLHRHHDVFRAMLQVNLTVLATAHAVSEGIVRGVNSEMARRASPQTYTAAGHRAAGARHATPLSVSRAL
ncbi:MAG: hypothetical protein EPO23_00015 [Xanthobacteraceae bacterium]|nr:MAG: hypothetical protein EPO23_00015 [Xanthobacteraceae bacterium]